MHMYEWAIYLYFVCMVGNNEVKSIRYGIIRRSVMSYAKHTCKDATSNEPAHEIMVLIT